MAARKFKVWHARSRTWSERLPKAALFPYPFRTVLRLMEDSEIQPLIRGDGSRRRCAELRAGLADYKIFLRGERDFDAEVGQIFDDAQRILLHISAPDQRAVIGKSFAASYDDEGGRIGKSAKAYVGFNIHHFLHDYTPDPIKQEKRAALWISRLHPDMTPDDAFAKACEVAQMGIEDRRRTIREIRQTLYRAVHRPRALVPKKLTDSDARTLRQEYRNGAGSFVALGKRFGISAAMVSGVITGSSYKKAGGPIYWPGAGWREETLDVQAKPDAPPT